MTTEHDWQPIETMPEGVRVEVRHEDCPGYDTTAQRKGFGIDCASWFIRADMRLLTNPTHWRPMQGAQK